MATVSGAPAQLPTERLFFKPPGPNNQTFGSFSTTTLPVSQAQSQGGYVATQQSQSQAHVQATPPVLASTPAPPAQPEAPAQAPDPAPSNYQIQGGGSWTGTLSGIGAIAGAPTGIGAPVGALVGAGVGLVADIVTQLWNSHEQKKAAEKQMKYEKMMNNRQQMQDQQAHAGASIEYLREKQYQEEERAFEAKMKMSQMFNNFRAMQAQSAANINQGNYVRGL